MKFEYIRKTDKPLMEYGHMLSMGDIVDLPEHLADKALKRPEDYRKVEKSAGDENIEYAESNDKASIDKPRRGRPPKVKNGDEN